MLPFQQGERVAGWVATVEVPSLHFSMYYCFPERPRLPGEDSSTAIDEAPTSDAQLRGLFKTPEDPHATQEWDPDYTVAELYARAKAKAEAQATPREALLDRPYSCQGSASEFCRLYEEASRVEALAQSKAVAARVRDSGLAHWGKAWPYFMLLEPGMQYSDAVEITGEGATEVEGTKETWFVFDSGVALYPSDGKVGKVETWLSK